ncbi:uncharacterized protein [Parasteatoda tepidariorum]
MLAVILETTRHGVHGGHHRNNGAIEKLLTAGLIAKALAKGGEEGGGGGGHHFVPVHIPVHHHGHHHHGHHHASASNNHHHHVHHKYVPIPVKHHTNFIIAHHKVPVHVHVPVPVVKTKVVHVPVEKTKIVPIIVNKDHDSHHHHHSQPSYPYMAHADTVLRPKKYKPSLSQPHIALATNSKNKQVRITSLGKVKQVKDPSSNGTSLKFQHSSGSPDKWIVVVKTKKRSSIRRSGDMAKRSDTTLPMTTSTTTSLKPKIRAR